MAFKFACRTARKDQFVPEPDTTRPFRSNLASFLDFLLFDEELVIHFPAHRILHQRWELGALLTFRDTRLRQYATRFCVFMDQRHSGSYIAGKPDKGSFKPILPLNNEATEISDDVIPIIAATDRMFGRHRSLRFTSQSLITLALEFSVRFRKLQVSLVSQEFHWLHGPAAAPVAVAFCIASHCEKAVSTATKCACSL